MVEGLLVLGAAIFWLWLFHFLQNRQESSFGSLLLDHEEMRCPSCNASLHIEEMFDAAVFWEPGAVVFDCSHCHDRVYFAPYEDYVEMGILGCSPVVDPIPLKNYSYPRNFEMASNTQDGILNVEIRKRSWAIPRYGLWNERADIPCPNPAAKQDVRK